MTKIEPRNKTLYSPGSDQRPGRNGHLGRRYFKGRKPTPKTTHPNRKSLRKQFSELFVQLILPLSFEFNRRDAERVWANCLRKLVSFGFIGVGGFLGWASFLSLDYFHNVGAIRANRLKPFDSQFFGSSAWLNPDPEDFCVKKCLEQVLTPPWNQELARWHLLCITSLHSTHEVLEHFCSFLFEVFLCVLSVSRASRPTLVYLIPRPPQISNSTKARNPVFVACLAT